MNRVDDLSTTLRSLDPADRSVDPTSARARADLHAILASAPAADDRRPAPSPRAPMQRPTVGRLALVGGLAGAIAAATVVMPSVTGGDEAFATWTAVPVEVSPAQRPEAAADCRKGMADAAGAEYADDLRTAATAVAESRGVWTTVVLAGEDGFTALCVTDDSSRLFDKATIGSLGVPTDYRTPGPRELFSADLGTGTVDGRDISLAAGHAGSDVVGVVYRSDTHGNVAATVSRGHFALWLPGDELADTGADGVEVEVAYRDGTTVPRTLTLGATS